MISRNKQIEENQVSMKKIVKTSMGYSMLKSYLGSVQSMSDIKNIDNMFDDYDVARETYEDTVIYKKLYES